MSVWEEDIKEVQRALEKFRKVEKRKEELKKALEYWIKVEDLGHSDNCEVVGVDGSFLVRPLIFSTFYLARAIAIAPSLGGFRVSRSDILKTTNDNYARQHAEAVMALLEVETATRALLELNKHGREATLLFDGSVSSLILHRVVLHRSPIYPNIADSISRGLSFLVNERNVVFVAKRSSNSIYGEGRLPDMMLFSSMPKGYSVPKTVKISELYNIPETELDDLPLSSKLKVLTLSYVKLSDDGPLLKIEIPGIVSEDEVRDVIAKLSDVSPSGYPVPLLVAHSSAKIRGITLRKALSLVGIRLPTGREALREAFA
ncbi:MAG: DNA double-strand break repair nuclease NurA [Candidatus Nezhaarchaeales archaeon]